MPISTDTCAREVLDVVPSVMRFIRSEMRSHRVPGLSVPQFRALLYIHHNQDVSLTDVSVHLGLTPATTSTLVDGLVKRTLVLRGASPADRRRMTLVLTPSGRKEMESALQETQKSLAAALASLAPTELQAVTQAMSSLRRTFTAVGHMVS